MASSSPMAVSKTFRWKGNCDADAFGPVGFLLAYLRSQNRILSQRGQRLPTFHCPQPHAALPQDGKFPLLVIWTRTGTLFPRLNTILKVITPSQHHWLS